MHNSFARCWTKQNCETWRPCCRGLFDGKHRCAHIAISVSILSSRRPLRLSEIAKFTRQWATEHSWFLWYGLTCKNLMIRAFNFLTTLPMYYGIFSAMVVGNPLATDSTRKSGQEAVILSLGATTFGSVPTPYWKNQPRMRNFFNET